MTYYRKVSLAGILRVAVTSSFNGAPKTSVNAGQLPAGDHRRRGYPQVLLRVGATAKWDRRTLARFSVLIWAKPSNSSIQNGLMGATSGYAVTRALSDRRQSTSGTLTLPLTNASAANQVLQWNGTARGEPECSHRQRGNHQRQ